jgi:hypothetical protein
MPEAAIAGSFGASAAKIISPLFPKKLGSVATDFELQGF